MSNNATQPRIEIVLLLLAGLFVSSFSAARPLSAQTEPMVTHANGWSFIDAIRVGQHGFTQLDSGRAGPGEMVVVSGVNNGRTGIFRVEAGVVTEVATDGAVLPGGLGTLRNVGVSAFKYAVLPNGDVIFTASAVDGSLNPNFSYTFRWRNGTITVAQPAEETDPQTLSQAFAHDLAQVTTDNRWLASLRTGAIPNTTIDYGLTDGATRSSIFSFTNSGANCIFTSAPLAAANANSVIAYYAVVQSAPLDGGRCANELGVSRAWSVKLAGAATGVIASGSSFEQVNIHTGAELNSSSLFLLNNQNQVAALRELYNSPTTFSPRRQLVIFTGNGGEQIIQDTDGAASGIFLADFDQQGRVLYSVSLDAAPFATVLLAGPSLDDDRVLGTGDALFGQAVVSLSWVARPAVTTDEGRTFAFQYGLADGAIGIALATQQPPQWNNPNGGDWGTAANWTPAAVPGAEDEARFNLSAAYAVNLGAQQVGDVAIQDGDVIFRNGTLNLPSTGGQLGVGARNPDDVARLTIAGTDTEITTPAVAVGVGGPGELRIESATVNFPNTAEAATGVTLGFAAPATATVTAGAFWLWPEMALALTHDALLRVEDGAVSGFGAERLFVGGSTLGLALRNQTGRVVVDNTTNAGGKLDLGTLLGPITELIVGEALIGRLQVTNGGRTLAVTTTVGTRDHGATTDGFLSVEGVNATQPALLTAGDRGSGGLFVATGAGTDALITVSAGGAMSLTQLSLADGAQSNALMFVDGMEAAEDGERRSTVIAPLPPAPEVNLQRAAQNPQEGLCIIGRTGRGTLNVSNGAQVRCRQIAVGFGAGSRGELNIDGSFRAVPAEVSADGPLPEDGAICIGRVPLCGATGNNVRGEVVLGVDGTLAGRIIAIGTGGRLRGSGIALAREGVVVIDGGSIAPGIVQIAGGQRAADETYQAGTLTIQGDLTISNTGVITLHVLGGAPELQDRLVVSGTADLNGQLVLSFGNGYAPKQGDQFALIAATAFTGTHDVVVITGLAAGFDYALGMMGGAVTLTALNDGVATTTPAALKLFLPVVTRS